MSPIPLSIWQNPAAKWHFILPPTYQPKEPATVMAQAAALTSQIKFYNIPNKAWSPEWDLYDDAFNEAAYRAALQRNADIPPREERTQPQLAWEQNAEDMMVVLASADSDLDSNDESNINTDSDIDEPGTDTDSVKHSELITESDSDELHTLEECRTVYHCMNER